MSDRFKYYIWGSERTSTFDALIVESNFYGYMAFRKIILMDTPIEIPNIDGATWDKNGSLKA